eukprot:2778967-Amphidinium_carterae.1
MMTPKPSNQSPKTPQRICADIGILPWDQVAGVNDFYGGLGASLAWSAPLINLLIGIAERGLALSAVKFRARSVRW